MILINSARWIESVVFLRLSTDAFRTQTKYKLFAKLIIRPTCNEDNCSFEKAVRGRFRPSFLRVRFALGPADGRSEYRVQ